MGTEGGSVRPQPSADSRFVGPQGYLHLQASEAVVPSWNRPLLSPLGTPHRKITVL